MLASNSILLKLYVGQTKYICCPELACGWAFNVQILVETKGFKLWDLHLHPNPNLWTD